MSDLFPILTTSLAALIQGCLGFGAGLISMAVLSLVWDVRDATIAMAPVGLAMVAALSFQLRHDATPRQLTPLFMAIPMGIFGGLYALDSLPGTLLKSLLGLILLVFVVHSLRKPTARPKHDHRRLAMAAGALSGFTGAALSSAGPPVLIFAAISGWEKDRFRANLSLIFLVISVLSVIGLILGDFFTKTSLLLSLKLIPGVLLGTYLGTKVAHRVPQTLFRQIVFAGMATIGIYFALSPLMGIS